MKPRGKGRAPGAVETSARSRFWPSHRWLSSAGAAPAVIAMTLGLTHAAVAEIGARPEQPAFTSTDLTIINRNESLKQIVTEDPWVVYRVLRAMDGAARELVTPAVRPEVRVDPKRDPDLGDLPRVAPEAAHDLFILLKKVGQKK